MTGLYDSDVPALDELGTLLYSALGFPIEQCNEVLRVVIEMANQLPLNERRGIVAFRNTDADAPRCVN
jgi:hypothetical protein